MSKPKITNARRAGPDHQVVTVEGGDGTYCRKVCPRCPWRIDQTGAFPAEAFAHSANTAYDMATHTFACHMASKERPKICAGFLLRGADHNMAVRLKIIKGELDPRLVTSDAELHDDYRAMAVANGLDEDDPALRRCR